MPSNPVKLCASCGYLVGITECRVEACENMICFPCVISQPTAGQCKTCFARFSNNYLDYRLKVLKEKSWLKSYYEKQEEKVEKIESEDVSKQLEEQQHPS